MEDQSYSKDVIRNRMYRHAMNFWGIKKVENLDPLIKILLEALASEICGLSHEIESSQHRVLDKIANMLTPDALVCARPSHGVCHILPWNMKRTILTRDEGFFVNALSDKEKEKEKYSFYPVKDTEIYGGDVCRMICNGDIYEIDSTMTKKLIHPAPSKMLGRFNYTIWIGLHLKDDTQRISNLPFYFELPHREDKQKLYSLLAYSKWSLNGKALTTRQGMELEIETDDPESLFSICDAEKEIQRDILTLYDNQFIRIKNTLSADQATVSIFPPELKDYYADISDTGKPLLWLRIDLPVCFTPDVLEELKVYMNAVVVENKLRKHININVNELTAVIPLPAKANEYFYAVESVTDVQNRKYTEISYKDKDGNTNCTYALRRGGFERMSSRDVKEYLYRVLDLLQDKGAFITSLAKDSFAEDIQEMDRLLNNMERMIDDMKSATGAISYLLADLPEKADMLYVIYYTTICEEANGLPVGATLTPMQDSNNIDDKTSCLLTTTRGGRGIPASTNRFDIYKYALTTRDRIVSKSDIKCFCYKELGAYLEDMYIETGVMVSEKPNEGLVRSVDVHLVMKEYISGVNELVDDLKIRLESRSLPTLNYRVFIDSPAL